MAATATDDRAMRQPAPEAGPAPAPPAPTSLADTGLSQAFVCDLVLKTLRLHGDSLGGELAQLLCLPFNILQGPLQHLKSRLLVEITGGDMVGPISYRYTLSEQGARRARELHQRCAYVGPAPVTLDAYSRRARRQRVRGIRCSGDRLGRAFEGLVVEAELITELGPALCSGSSVFLHGPPGNGKTCIARALGAYLNANGGEIHVPYAILAESSVITVFDPTIHEPLQAEAPSNQAEAPDAVRRFLNGDARRGDARWRNVRRPVVITGGELTLDMLELRFDRTSNIYQAPLHVKANGGLFLIDDFGRQLVRPRDLLNRWILPLEEHEDHLTLQTGRKICVPFEQLIIFSTNLEPRDLVDDAFLRRMRHRIKIDKPDRQLLERIFQLVCSNRGLHYGSWVVDYLFERHYDGTGRPPRNSDPRDLVEVLESVCAFEGRPLELTPDRLQAACDLFFGEL